MVKGKETIFEYLVDQNGHYFLVVNYSLTQSLTYSLTQSLTHSLTHSLNRSMDPMEYNGQ